LCARVVSDSASVADGTVDSDSGDYCFATCMQNDLSVALTPMRGATCMTVAGAVMG